MDIRNSLSVLTLWAVAMLTVLMSYLTLSHTCGCNTHTPTHHSHPHVFPTPLHLVETAVSNANPFGKRALSESRCWMYALGSKKTNISFKILYKYCINRRMTAFFCYVIPPNMIYTCLQMLKITLLMAKQTPDPQQLTCPEMFVLQT